jgi:hypothetical protein
MSGVSSLQEHNFTICKAISFTTIRVKDPLNYSLGTKKFRKEQLLIFGNYYTQSLQLGWSSLKNRTKSLGKHFISKRLYPGTEKEK